uniref:RNA helicase n=1 Tax=Parascaris univalens TaxID=6257 RepID=A0A915ALZ7_PARUN
SSTLSVCMLSSDEDEKENENTNVVDDDNEGNSSSVEESADEDDASDAYNLEEPENNGEVKSVEDTDSEAETAELTIDVPDSKLIQANLVVSEAKTFSELGLSRWVCEQLRQLSVKLPTPVQANCIPHILAGSDVLGCAKTGTGKTLAFALPILNQLAVDPFGIYALVLTPTRELAFQIAEQFVALGARIGLKTTVIVGGRDQVEQAKNLASFESNLKT